MTGALKIAEDAFQWASGELPPQCELEIFLSQGRARSVIWSEKKCEDISQAEGGGLGVRVILHENGSKQKGGGPASSAGRQGFAFTTSFFKDSVQKAAGEALDSARMLPQDEFRRLPRSLDEAKVSDLFDLTAFSESVTGIQERLKEGEDRLLKKYPLLRSVLRAAFSEGESETAIVNSNGIEKSFSGTHSGLGVSCLAEKDGERQEGGFGLSKRFRKELDWESIFEKASERTHALLGGHPIPSGSVPVVFDPSIACEFLSLVGGMVCADSIQKGKSPFKGKLGEEVASKNVSVIDNGALEKGLASSPVDDEGVATQKTPVIVNGKLAHYLYDTYTALKDGARSTGNAGRAGFKSSPQAGTTNFYIDKGGFTRKELLAQTRGLYLYEAMGLHMADPISGDFSVGAIGAWLENGEFKSGVRGVTLAGNLLDLLKNIDAVSDDLTFFGSHGSPTFRVSQLSVSGA